MTPMCTTTLIRTISHCVQGIGVPEISATVQPTSSSTQNSSDGSDCLAGPSGAHDRQGSNQCLLPLLPLTGIVCRSVKFSRKIILVR